MALKVQCTYGYSEKILFVFKKDYIYSSSLERPHQFLGFLVMSIAALVRDFLPSPGSSTFKILIYNHYKYVMVIPLPYKHYINKVTLSKWLKTVLIILIYCNANG